MNTIINPINGEKYDLYSTKGRTLLKEYIQNYKIGGMMNYVDDIDFKLLNTTKPPEYEFPFSIWDPDVGSFVTINNYGDIIRLIETYPSMTEKDVRSSKPIITTPISQVPTNELTPEQRKYSIMIDNFKRNRTSPPPRRSERLKLKST